MAFLLLAGTAGVRAQQCDVPQIGAQVFVEPGQTPEDIDGFFRLLRDNGMKVARIRMFGAHMYRGGEWDFSLYDEAFRAADKYGVRLFATLFPVTDELNDVGGFKFPRSKAHLREIDDYITAVVSHFRQYESLWTWVLQNEPGSGGTRVAMTDLAREVYDRWLADFPPEERGEGYLKADFTQEKFLTYYTTWYLNHIAQLVERLDPQRGRHINPHQILGTLPDYDFPAYSKFLTSVGASLHLSWHFGMFSQREYPLGVSLMSDIIRHNALGNPFWITELQGGNVTASGNVPYCPTAAHTAQYLWTAIASGAEGVIFWSLNQRAAVMEAGEWGLLDFLRRPSDRMLEAAKVASVLQRHGEELRGLKPAPAPVTLLYNIASLRIQRRNAETLASGEEGRQASACMKSLAAAYEAVSAWGVTPQVADMATFDWDDAAGCTAVIPHMVALPSEFRPRIESFVRNGGKLIVTGLSGFYDENMRCLFMNGFPLKSCFGAEVSEFKVAGEYFTLGEELPAHLWRGILVPASGETMMTDGGDVAAVRNRYGRGEVVWVPSPIELGGYHRDMAPLTAFYGRECRDAIDAAPASFSTPDPDVLMRTMCKEGVLMTVIVNKRPESAAIRLRTGRYGVPRVIYGEASVKGAQVTVGADRCAVVLWSR